MASASASASTSAAAVGTETPSKRGSNVACLACRAIKVKCTRAAPTDERCRRCDRLDLDCLYKAHHRGRGSPGPEDRPAGVPFSKKAAKKRKTSASAGEGSGAGGDGDGDGEEDSEEEEDAGAADSKPLHPPPPSASHTIGQHQPHHLHQPHQYNAHPNTSVTPPVFFSGTSTPPTGVGMMSLPSRWTDGFSPGGAGEHGGLSLVGGGGRGPPGYTSTSSYFPAAATSFQRASPSATNSPLSNYRSMPPPIAATGINNSATSNAAPSSTSTSSAAQQLQQEEAQPPPPPPPQLPSINSSGVPSTFFPERSFQSASSHRAKLFGPASPPSLLPPSFLPPSLPPLPSTQTGAAGASSSPSSGGQAGGVAPSPVGSASASASSPYSARSHPSPALSTTGSRATTGSSSLSRARMGSAPPWSAMHAGQAMPLRLLPDRARFNMQSARIFDALTIPEGHEPEEKATRNSSAVFRKDTAAQVPRGPVEVATSLRDDAIVKGIINDKDAEQLFAFFHDKLNIVLDLLDPLLHTASYTRQHYPIVFSTVISVSARFSRPELYDDCFRICEAILALAAVLDDCSLDFVQALSVRTLWKSPGDARAWSRVGRAIGMAYELGLHHSFAADSAQLSGFEGEFGGAQWVDTQREGESYAAYELRMRERRNRQRTWIQLCCFDSSLFGKISHMGRLQHRPYLIDRTLHPDAEAWYEENYEFRLLNDGRLVQSIEGCLLHREVRALRVQIAQTEDLEGLTPTVASLMSKMEAFRYKWFSPKDPPFVPLDETAKQQGMCGLITGVMTLNELLFEWRLRIQAQKARENGEEYDFQAAKRPAHISSAGTNANDAASAPSGPSSPRTERISPAKRARLDGEASRVSESRGENQEGEEESRDDHRRNGATEQEGRSQHPMLPMDPWIYFMRCVSTAFSSLRHFLDRATLRTLAFAQDFVVMFAAHSALWLYAHRQKLDDRERKGAVFLLREVVTACHSVTQELAASGANPTGTGSGTRRLSKAMDSSPPELLAKFVQQLLDIGFEDEQNEMKAVEAVSATGHNGAAPHQPTRLAPHPAAAAMERYDPVRMDGGSGPASGAASPSGRSPQPFGPPAYRLPFQSRSNGPHTLTSSVTPPTPSSLHEQMIAAATGASNTSSQNQEDAATARMLSSQREAAAATAFTMMQYSSALRPTFTPYSFPSHHAPASALHTDPTQGATLPNTTSTPIGSSTHSHNPALTPHLTPFGQPPGQTSTPLTTPATAFSAKTGKWENSRPFDPLTQRPAPSVPETTSVQQAGAVDVTSTDFLLGAGFGEQFYSIEKVLDALVGYQQSQQPFFQAHHQHQPQQDVTMSTAPATAAAVSHPPSSTMPPPSLLSTANGLGTAFTAGTGAAAASPFGGLGLGMSGMGMGMGMGMGINSLGMGLSWGMEGGNPEDHAVSDEFDKLLQQLFTDGAGGAPGGALGAGTIATALAGSGMGGYEV